MLFGLLIAILIAGTLKTQPLTTNFITLTIPLDLHPLLAQPGERRAGYAEIGSGDDSALQTPGNDLELEIFQLVGTHFTSPVRPPTTIKGATPAQETRFVRR